MQNSNQMFLNLVFSLAQAALVCLGKLQSHTGGVDQDLRQAKLNIDMIEMLKTKTINNLTAGEEKILHSTLADLQLNYIEELNKTTVPEPVN